MSCGWCKPWLGAKGGWRKRWLGANQDKGHEKDRERKRTRKGRGQEAYMKRTRKGQEEDRKRTGKRTRKGQEKDKRTRKRQEGDRKRTGRGHPQGRNKWMIKRNKAGSRPVLHGSTGRKPCPLATTFRGWRGHGSPPARGVAQTGASNTQFGTRTRNNKKDQLNDHRFLAASSLAARSFVFHCCPARMAEQGGYYPLM